MCAIYYEDHIKTHSLLALAMIDPATGCFEFVRVTNKSAISIQRLIHNAWLARNPPPQFIFFDNESKFKSEPKQMCENYGNKGKPATSNPQSTIHNPEENAIIERVHKMVNDMLRLFDFKNENLQEDMSCEFFLQSC
jgi:hypothetical protein